MYKIKATNYWIKPQSSKPEFMRQIWNICGESTNTITEQFINNCGSLNSGE